MTDHDPGPRPLFTLSGPFDVGMIWAQTPDGVIGADGTLAWHIPEDLAHFRATTRGYPVIHGRASYEALPAPFRPLPGRRNIVLTRQAGYEADGAEVVTSLQEAMGLVGPDPVWIVGGGQVYTQAMPYADALVVTEVDLHISGDTFAPAIDPAVWRAVQHTDWVTSLTGTTFRVVEYRRH